MAQIQITELQLNQGEPFTLEDFAHLENHDSICMISRDLQSIAYHFRLLSEGISLQPIEIDDSNDVLDGYHRIAAIAYYNHCNVDQITEVEYIRV